MNELLLSIAKKSCLAFSDPKDCSIPGFPVLHYLLELPQTHVHWVSDAIQPSHLQLPFLLLPSIFPSIRVFSNELALCIKWSQCLEFQYQSFQLIFRLNTNNECLQMCHLIYKPIFITMLQMYCLLNIYWTPFMCCVGLTAMWERYGIC